jgi:Tfp pilus assembly pilus retraction ATPase PilT
VADDLLRQLQGVLSAKEIKLVRDSVSIRFNDYKNEIRHKESFVLYEQNLISEPDLRILLENLYGMKLSVVRNPYVTDDIKEYVRKLGNAVPLRLDASTSKIHIGVLPEWTGRIFVNRHGTYEVVEEPIALYDYISLYMTFYGVLPDFVADYPVSDLFNYIVEEAVSLKASDITIAEKKDKVIVFFNINKRKVYSNRLLPKRKMGDLFSVVTSKGNSPASFTGTGTIYLSMPLDFDHRGRVVLNKTYYGWTITIRILSNRSINTTLRQLNLPEDGIGFISQSMLTQSAGLKLFAGPTMSGKNTTILSAFFQYMKEHDCKIVSAEQPVEIIADFIEQIDCATDDDYEKAVDSMLRQNPDIIYITEMTDRTAKGTLKTANTGKAVFSTLHTNNIAEIISRLYDLTEIPVPQIIMVLDTVFFQQLVPKFCPICNDMGCPDCYKAGMVPVVEYFKFTPTIKQELIGKSLAEIYSRIRTIMQDRCKEDFARDLLEKGIISRRTYEQHIAVIS